MTRPPLFMETLAARGLAEEPRPLGAALKVMLTDACWRCSGGTGQECAACIAEIAMRDDEVSHANEQAMHDARWSALADDEWGDL